LLATIWFPRNALYTPGPKETRNGLDGFPQPNSEPPVSLTAGLAVAKACLSWAQSKANPFKQGLAVKWPNDLLCGNRKLAGILCEATEHSIYVGMGINCSQDSFTGLYRTKPTSILLETGMVPERYSLLVMIIDELQTLISRRTSWLVELDHLLAWKGEMVYFRQGLAEGQPLRGIFTGVTEDGGLVLETNGSRKCFHSGELSPVIDEGP
jgi:BirA family biotin operon repressor/biotin-[acetyl-CoA-carboxylase] ligase